MINRSPEQIKKWLEDMIKVSAYGKANAWHRVGYADERWYYWDGKYNGLQGTYAYLFGEVFNHAGVEE